jgi:hypothetical protein
MVWEAVFMLLILKIPIIYLGWVVYWAIKAEPHPEEGAVLPVAGEPDPRPGWSRRGRLRGPRHEGPHRGPSRIYPRRRAPMVARAEARNQQ